MSLPFPRSLLIAAIFAFCFIPNVSLAMAVVAPDDSEGPALESASPAAPSGVPVLPRVTVVGTEEASMNGKASLDRDAIESVPAGNGSLNDLLKILPGIQAGDASRSSRTAGEILPPPLSISGGKVYENNFLLDGIGNNSLLDPTFSDQSNRYNVPGHPQEFFFDPNIIEKVTVYRSNVSARYGRFTGGVVDAETRRPAEVFGFSTAFRTTRSEWTRFHLDDAEKEEFENSRSEADQPRFRKEELRLMVDLPLADHLGVLLQASSLRSRIPLTHLGGTEQQTRSSMNLFSKILFSPTPRTEWTLSGFWSPYEAEYFLEDVRNSRYMVDMGGYGLHTSLQHYFPLGTWELKGGYQESVNSRRAPNDYFAWNVNSATKNWGALVGDRTSLEGGLGDEEKEEESVTLQSHFTAEPVRTWSVSHVLAAGLEYERAAASFERTEFATTYSWDKVSLNAGVQCAPEDPACIAGEQFLNYKTVSEPDRATASITFYDAYLEDRTTFGRFGLRPGLRFSRNGLLDNSDLAPRLAASLDPFGDGRTILFAGVNRYYGGTLLTNALAEKKKPFTIWNRTLDSANLPQPWTAKPRTTIAAVRVSDLDTPFTDEVTAGIGQSFLGGRLDLLFIDRRGRDELTTRILKKDANGYIYREWTNEGRTRHREYSLSWERKWQRHYLLLDATWQETTTSHLDYAEIFAGDAVEDPVWYQGRAVEQSELPALDFNRRWTGNALYRVQLPFGFSFTNLTRYRSGFRALDDTGKNTALPDEPGLDIYEEVNNPESWIFDWILAWTTGLPFPGALTLTLEIDNVFDEGHAVGGSSTEKELGRQFWAEAEYRF